MRTFTLVYVERPLDANTAAVALKLTLDFEEGTAELRDALALQEAITFLEAVRAEVAAFKSRFPQ